MKMQSKNLPAIDTDPLPGVTGRGIIKKEIETQSKSHPGVNLFKDRYMSIQHQEDSFTSDTAPRKFSTNEISFSSFDNQERPYESISPHVTEPPKANPGTSRAGSTIYKAIQLPSLNKELSGHPKNSISKKHVKLTNTLPAVISTTRKPIYEEPKPKKAKAKSIGYRTASRSVAETRVGKIPIWVQICLLKMALLVLGLYQVSTSSYQDSTKA
ncbi:uncharacterized protein LOC125282787 [Ursus arctos]|uniref:uncharacterized protein LOC125282787 n=1 Tax=Ursus arctos TaxID=9644 RepID=UPI002546ACB5|nr:uncharacterized protein LOC125282787 [Ursus arctos]